MNSFETFSVDSVFGNQQLTLPEHCRKNCMARKLKKRSANLDRIFYLHKENIPG